MLRDVTLARGRHAQSSRIRRTHLAKISAIQHAGADRRRAGDRCVGLGGSFAALAFQREAVAAIQKVGGSVTYDWEMEQRET